MNGAVECCSQDDIEHLWWSLTRPPHWSRAARVGWPGSEWGRPFGRVAVRVLNEKEWSRLLELGAYKIPSCALGGGRGAVATRHSGVGIAHYARRMRLPGAMPTVNWLHGRFNRTHPSYRASGTVNHAARLPSGRLEDAVADADAVGGRLNVESSTDHS